MTNGIQHLLLNGAELGYCTHGTGLNKPPLVFVHGHALRSTAGPYEELLGRLAHHYAVYALDLRGHGESADAVAGWSLSALADDVAAFSRTLELDRPVFVGHSAGAFTGLFAEIRHPGTFAALCLLTPGPADPTRDPVDGLEFLIEHGHSRDMLREGFGHMFTRPPGQMLDSVLDAITLVDIGVHRALHQQNSQISIDDQLKDVAAPALLLSGERDNVVAPARQHDMARKLHRSKEVVFSTEGHMLPFESTAIAAREILAFLEHDRGPLAIAPMGDSSLADV